MGEASNISSGVTGSFPRSRLPRERWGGWALTALGTAIDASVLRAMQFVVDRALIPDAADVDSLRASAKAILAPEIQADPRRYFGFLDDEPLLPRVTRVFGRRLDGGYTEECRMDSAYQPWSGEAGAACGGPILFEHWRHAPGPPRATVVALHGFTMGRPRFDAFALFASQWFALGLDVALVTLPHHGARSVPEARFSGERFTVPHVERLGEAVRESLYELRLLVHWLREQSGAPVGVLGLSLGGYLAALAAGLLDDLDFVVPMVAPVCIGDLAWRFFTRTSHYATGGDAVLGPDELRRSFRVHSPLAHPIRVPKERVLIVAGRGDRIVPSEHPTALWRHWGEPAIHWYSGSHLAPFDRGRIVAAIAGHLESIGVL